MKLHREAGSHQAGGASPSAPLALRPALPWHVPPGFHPLLFCGKKEGREGRRGGHGELISLGSAREKTPLKLVIPGLEISSGINVQPDGFSCSPPSLPPPRAAGGDRAGLQCGFCTLVWCHPLIQSFPESTFLTQM